MVGDEGKEASILKPGLKPLEEVTCFKVIVLCELIINRITCMCMLLLCRILCMYILHIHKCAYI